MRSRIFSSPEYQRIEYDVLELLNAQHDFLSPHTLHSTRAAGDAIERIIADSFHTVLGKWSTGYSSQFARRAMADIAFTAIDGFYYVIDVKTHRTDTRFSMPNLTSVERLMRFYEDDSNYFALLLVSYQMDSSGVSFTEVRFTPIEFLSWDCLTIGALGWGQIQIADANRIVMSPGQSRRKWVLELCDVLLEFYPKEIGKIAARIEHFEKMRDTWLARPDM